MKLLIDKSVGNKLTFISTSYNQFTSVAFSSNALGLMKGILSAFNSLGINFIEIVQENDEDIIISEEQLEDVKNTILNTKVFILGKNATKILTPDLIRDRSIRFSNLTNMPPIKSHILNHEVGFRFHLQQEQER
jgi:hypothetical protein